MAYSIGLDFGTSSVRSLVVNTATGHEAGSVVYEYESGQAGIILDPKDHSLARQNPADYLAGIERTITRALAQAAAVDPDFSPDAVIGIGIDTTGSSPVPVDAAGTPLCMTEEFADNPNAMVWLWKDHTAHEEAAEITALARRERPAYLAKCGGTYSSEWFFSKLLHCLRVAPKVFAAAHTWVEYCDWLAAVLTGNEKPTSIVRSRCAAGHKAMFNDAWGGLPDREFLGKLDPQLAAIRDRLYRETKSVDQAAGRLTAAWASRLALPVGIPVAVSAFDCHLGAIGAGIAPGRMVKVMGTSTCDIIVADQAKPLADIVGVCGIVNGSVLPGYYGIEAGQSAVGDIFNWFVGYMQPGGAGAGSHAALTEKAQRLKPGQSGLLALDWNNGNRTILVDPRLSGLLVGQTLQTTPAEIYRALIEATAFGALAIIRRVEEYGVKIEEIVACGGIAEKNPLIMQIYADVTNRELKLSRSSQTCALGSAVAAAVVAGGKAGGYDDFASAQAAMTGLAAVSFKPIPENVSVYARLGKLYRQLHDSFGVAGTRNDLSSVMKELIDTKEACQKA